SALSPDEKRLMVARYDQVAGYDLWLIDLLRGTNTRFTFDDTHNETNPVWSPDGSRVVFSSNKAGNGDLYEKSANGSGEEKLPVTASGRFLSTVARGRVGAATAGSCFF